MGNERRLCVSSILLSFMILSKLSIKFSVAASALHPNQTIHDGQLLISANKTFKLGFCSAGSNNCYVGVWSHNLPVQTVVWVAKRERPVLDSSGFITIDPHGNLIILDSVRTSFLMASNSGTTNLTSATLLDAGNLVLKASNGMILWQSFDHPTDNFLHGMKLRLNGKQNRLVNSWRNPQDPSAGDFSLGIDPNGMKQFFVWKRGQVYWSSGV